MQLETLVVLAASTAIFASVGCLGEIGDGGSSIDHPIDDSPIDDGPIDDGAATGSGSAAAPGGSDGLVCSEPGHNACGGCAILNHELLSPCGTCGTWVCADDDDSLICEQQAPNACGGCTTLSNTLGSPCNTCGTWACSGTESLTCDEAACLDCLDEPFDLSQVVEWRGRGNATSWPVMSGLTVDVVGSWLNFNFNQPGSWIGDGSTCSEFFVIYQDAGVWVAQIADYLGCESSQHQKYGFFDDWGPNNDWYRISPGDPVGFLVTSQSMSGGAHVPMYERTSVHMMCW